jgi:DNA-binding protein HU-beta
MPDRIEKPAVVRLVAQRTGREPELVEEILDAALEEIYGALRRGQSVSLRNFGSFYVRPETEQWVFRFNPAQRLRKLFAGVQPIVVSCDGHGQGFEVRAGTRQ